LLVGENSERENKRRRGRRWRRVERWARESERTDSFASRPLSLLIFVSSTPGTD